MVEHLQPTPANATSGPEIDRFPAGVSLFWIPLGAGGSGFVRMNGRIFEALSAIRDGRPRLGLLHTALIVRSGSGDYVVETMWPSPGGDLGSRGVVVEAPVFTGWLSSTRVFRYEVRRWRDGVLPDAGYAIGGPQIVSTDSEVAERLLALCEVVPRLVWGRDQVRVGDMWNSNSVISWLLVGAGVEIDQVLSPPGTRAPGWDAGIAVARSQVRAGAFPAP